MGGGSVVVNLPANAADARDTGSILGQHPEKENGKPFIFSCL